MDFRLTDDQELVVENLTEFLQRIMPQEKIEEVNRTGQFPWDAWKELADSGFLSIGWPESVGGVPADLLTQVLVNITMCRYGGVLGAFYALGLTTVHDIVQFGTQIQIEKYVKPFLQGGPPISLGVSEPSTGSDVASMQTSYVWDGKTAVINGSKHYNTCGDEAQAIIIIAKDAKAKNVHMGSTMFIVDKDTPGVTVTRNQKYGHDTGATSICEVRLDNVRVPKSAILGKEHRGFQQTMANFARERLCNTSGSLATALNAYDDACNYANQRVQFGETIGTYQLVQELIMEMTVRIENMYNMIYKLVWKIENNMDIRIDQGVAKYYCAKATFEVCDMALQVLAGVGVVGDHRVGKYFMDSRTGRIAGGTDQVMIFNTVPQILKKYKK